MSTQRPPLPPFTLETAVKKVRLAEDGWNSRDPEKVALAYTVDSYWRNRAEFVQGREAIIGFLTRKWQRELDYRLHQSYRLRADRRRELKIVSTKPAAAHYSASGATKGISGLNRAVAAAPQTRIPTPVANGMFQLWVTSISQPNTGGEMMPATATPMIT